MTYDVITIGTATQDMFLRGSMFKGEIKDPKELKKLGIHAEEATCFGLGSKISIEEPAIEVGGAAINAATTFSRQGLKTAAFFKIGNDQFGKTITNAMKKDRIANIGLVDKNVKTAFSSILLSPDSERTILTYRGASETVRESEIPFSKFNSKWVYISPSNIKFNIVEKIVSHFYNQKTLVAINPSSAMIKMGIKKLMPILKKTDVLILNREEASYLTKIDYNNKEQIFKKLDGIVKGIFVMTDGKTGAWISDNENIYEVGVFKNKKRADKTGAGDSFGSGFIAGLMQKHEECKTGLCNIDNVKYAARLASANATSNVEQIGATTGILTKKEFETNSRWKKLNIKVMQS